MIFELADQIVNLINSETYAQNFTAEAKFPTESSVTEIRDLTVRVIPTNFASTNFTRSTVRNALTVQIAIQKHLDDNIDEKIREMHELVVEIQKSIVRKDIEGYCYISSNINPIYQVDHLMQSRIFSSAIELNYYHDYKV